MFQSSTRPGCWAQGTPQIVLACLVAAWLMPFEPLWGADSSDHRNLSFTNLCPYPVWLESVGANAAVIACTPSTTSAQANCPDGFICYQVCQDPTKACPTQGCKDFTANYCVPGTTSATKFPVTCKTEITLNAAGCKQSGTVETNQASDQWGQCTCANNGGCPANQVCKQVTSTTHQCYWGFAFSGDGKLAPNGAATTLQISTSSTGSNIIASGNFIVKTACDGSGGNCLSGQRGTSTPVSTIEYTFQNDNDFYDVSYLNGINTPVMMFPVPAANLDYKSSDPYRCMAAGGNEHAIQTILNQAGNRGNGALKPFACASNYDSIFVKSLTSNLTGFNFVYSTTTPANCTSSADCAGSAGKTCGLSLASVLAASTQLTCGDRLGYWSYAQFCAANPNYTNRSLGSPGIDCGNATTRGYAMCQPQDSSDSGPGRSCFNSSTTHAGDTCCGFEAWTLNGASQPASLRPVSGVNTSYWVTNILPAVKLIKDGCPLAYSYQFDDAYATFTCATTGTPNQTNYQVTLCPGGINAGIAPPPPP